MKLLSVLMPRERHLRCARAVGPLYSMDNGPEILKVCQEVHVLENG